MPTPDPSSAPTPRLPGILVADDDDQVRAMLELVFRGRGLIVWTVRDGQEAVALYETHRDSIDLVLLDVQMPRLDGPGALATIRKVTPNARCCFMTGDSGKWPEAKLRVMGAEQVFKKPFGMKAIDTLAEMVLTGRG